jgi:xanthine dehydrogenase accessory factor
MNVFARLLEAIAAEGAGALVSVTETDGSAPREEGASMVVRPSGAFQGTIGGGTLEWGALAQARTALEAGRGAALMRLQHLGPDLGQCCGGRVRLRIETFDTQDTADLQSLAALAELGPLVLATSLTAEGRVLRQPAPSDLHRNPPDAGVQLERHGEVVTPLLLFGAGHVARALVLALAPLPFRTRWIDERVGAFPALMPPNVDPVQTKDSAAEVAAAPPDAFVLVMTHSHALDFDIVAAALSTPNLPYVGLIGSETKRARFERRLRTLGISEDRIRSLVCPIGLEGIGGKEPAVIAASTAAQLLLARQWADG